MEFFAHFVSPFLRSLWPTSIVSSCLSLRKHAFRSRRRQKSPISRWMCKTLMQSKECDCQKWTKSHSVHCWWLMKRRECLPAYFSPSQNTFREYSKRHANASLAAAEFSRWQLSAPRTESDPWQLPYTSRHFSSPHDSSARCVELGFLVRPEGWTTSPFTGEIRVCSLLYARSRLFFSLRLDDVSFASIPRAHKQTNRQRNGKWFAGCVIDLQRRC